MTTVDKAIDAIAKAMHDDDHATPEAVGLPALELLREFMLQQRRTADALERIASSLEAPEAR